MDLRARVIRGSIWNSASNICAQALNFIVTIVLARLLVPEDFGIIAISGVVVGVITLFQDLGMGSAIIQKKDISEDYLATSFLVSFLTGVGIAVLVVAISPLIASFYEKQILKPVIMVSSIGFVLSPLMSIHNSILTKNLEFKKIGVLNILTQFLSGGTSIVMALTGFGIWSLVLGKLLAQSVMIPLYWRTAKWTPRFRFRRRCFDDLFSFSSGLLGFNILNYFSRNGDNLIVGKYLGATTLGYYSIAYNLMLKPLQLISWSVGRVLFPTFSSIQDDNDRLRGGYTKVVRMISLVTFPMMAGLLVVAREFVMTFYGARWEPVVVPLQLLCMVGALQSVSSTGGAVMLSKGRSDVIFKLGLLEAVLMLSAFLIGIRWGLTGLIVAYMAASVPAFWVGQHCVNRLVDLKMKVFFHSLLPAAVCSVGMGAALIGAKRLVLGAFHVSPPVALAILIPSGIVIYMVTVTKYFFSEELYYIRDGIKESLGMNNCVANKKEILL